MLLHLYIMIGDSMRIVVCVRKLQSGELNPFDACAYEAALRIQGAEVILLSMGPLSVKELLLDLTRLGAKRAILLSDNAFAGADTLATSYTLNLALKRLSPDLIICGRQTVDGDTGQVGPELAQMSGYSLVTNVMEISQNGDSLVCKTRLYDSVTIKFPTLITLEKINTLRLPSIRSKKSDVEIWTAEDIGADPERTGLRGSPTKVLATFKNEQDRRNCHFISKDDLDEVIENALKKERVELNSKISSSGKLEKVFAVGETPIEMAKTVSDNITVIPLTDAYDIAEKIKVGDPDAVIWGSDLISKRVAPEVAAMLNTGLCADCTLLESDGNELYMYRPAFSGNIIAKIKCTTRPKMATVRTLDESGSRVAVGVGFGARFELERVKAFAQKIKAEICATRKMVDHDFLPYEAQVGLTGKNVNPDVYIAIGVSGAVHHIVGMKQSGTVIAINPDRDAEIFKYADYGIVCNFEDI